MDEQEQRNGEEFAPIGGESVNTILDSKLRQQAEFLTQLYNSVPCGIIQFTTDPSHRITHANRRAWEIYGYSTDVYYKEIQDPFFSVPEHLQDEFRALVDQISREGGHINYEREGIRRDGSSCYVSVYMERLVNTNGEEVIQAVFDDVTERRELQSEREQERMLENQMLRAAIFTAYPLVMSINLTQNVFECLATGEFIIHHPPFGCYDEMITEVLNQVYPTNRTHVQDCFGRESLLAHFQRGNTELYTEIKQMGTDGQYHWISAHIIRVENPYDDDVLSIFLFRLLDEQRAEEARQEQLLRDALAAAQAANEAKSSFLSRMSHDIRTPMNAIVGMSAIGQMAVDNPEKVRDCFQKIDTSSQYLLSLINDILDMAKIEQGKMVLTNAPFNLFELLDEIASIIRPQALRKPLEFQVRKCMPLSGLYLGDSLRLRQILMNLLSNALKFTPMDGKILLEVRETGRRDDKVDLEFRVSDNGIGMSEDFLKRLYQPFEQEDPGVARNQAGSGLGLSIVYNLVQLMQGSLEVESALGKGTSFTIRLPLGQDTEGRPSWEETPETPAGDYGAKLRGRRVLLVEDNALNREIAQTLLELQGILVETAKDGREAVARFSQSEPGGFLAVLMDIRMPEMDGLEATRAIRALGRADARTIPILAMSANAFAEDQALAREAGMSGYLVKPIDTKELFRTLGVLCGGAE